MAKHRLVSGRRRAWLAGGVVVVLAAGAGSYVALRSSPSPAAQVKTSDRPTSSTTSTTVQRTTASRIHVVSMTPQNGATGVTASQPVSITFSREISGHFPMPTVSPNVPGTWHVVNGDTLTFSPSQPFVPLTQVKVTVPAGRRGPVGTNGGTLAARVVDRFTMADGSTLRLQQLLSILDYSPLSWQPSSTPIAAGDATAQLEAMYSPPAGNFAWRNSGWPSQLLALWKPGTYNVFTRGLVMSYQADHGLIVNGTTSEQLWSSLIQTVAAGDVNTGGYNYAIGNKVPPESLTIWHDGTVVLHSAANTGIPQSPTQAGTYPVFARYRHQIMRGKNPDGSSYADPVQFVAYFHGGDAVHYFPRAAYGIPQSLGCIELPLAAAAQAWPYLAYGTLVTVIN